MAIAAFARHPHLRRWLVGVLAALVVAAALGLDHTTPAIITAAALGPAVCFAALITHLDHRSPRPWLAFLAALLWGGTVAALGSLIVNDFALRLLPQQWVSTWVAPLFEEAFKGSALIVVLLVWGDAWRGVREGIICGALAGIGFAATENLGYYVLAMLQGGSTGLARAVYLRGLLEGFNHAAFTATIGAGAGYARARATSPRGAFAVALGGFALAVAIHLVWNVTLSPRINEILCNASAPGGACAPAPDFDDLLLRVPALIAVFIGPAAILLALLVWRAEADG